MDTNERQRLQRLENAEIARATLTRYCRGLDTRDLALLESLFDAHVALVRPDGETIHGRDAAMAFFRSALATPIDHRKHYITNSEVAADGAESVRLTAYLLVVDQHHGELMLGWGTYTARVSIQAECGRIAELRIGLTMPPSPVKGMLDRFL
jgi:SnoaL-like domain